ncbi:hypothetical protein [Kitasatospora sp. GP82]|uniref:hypothetical protein n=1 Tax=Kitasatospora sp. GP82 TaxID=3035089 RepID=UPI00247D0A45|nr:hypothetical protein [Kitasatospora sp. GP82]
MVALWTGAGGDGVRGELVVGLLGHLGEGGGNPARPIRRRFAEEDVDRLLRAAWSHWPVELVTEHLRAIMSGTPAEIEEVARRNGLSAQAGGEAR